MSNEFTIKNGIKFGIGLAAGKFIFEVVAGVAGEYTVPLTKRLEARSEARLKRAQHLYGVKKDT